MIYSNACTIFTSCFSVKCCCVCTMSFCGQYCKNALCFKLRFKLDLSLCTKINIESTPCITAVSAQGSKHTTSYFWDFKDNYNTTVTDLDTAQAQIHYFRQPGVYHVTVTASNSNGTSSSNGALVRVEGQPECCLEWLWLWCL